MLSEKAITNIKRQTMPMTQHWHAKRGFKDVFDALFQPFVITSAIVAASLTEVAQTLQKAVFHTEAK